MAAKKRAKKKIGDVKSFIVERGKWVRGGLGKGNSAMLNRYGYMCCLGFYGAACGLSRSQLLNTEDPHEVANSAGFKRSDVLLKSGNRNRKATEDPMEINDTERCGYSEEERERDLKAKFKSLGIAVRFVD